MQDAPPQSYSGSARKGMDVLGIVDTPRRYSVDQTVGRLQEALRERGVTPAQDPGLGRRRGTRVGLLQQPGVPAATTRRASRAVAQRGSAGGRRLEVGGRR